jgi:hypothetical protein
MTTAIGPKGHTELTTPAGPVRKLRALHFYGRATTGACDNSQFRAGEAIVGVVDMTKGRVVTASFDTVANGSINQADTGGLGADGAFTGHELIALMLTDTGAVG